MAVWDGPTRVNFTPDGNNDLQMDAYTGFAVYESLQYDIGSLDYHTLDTRFEYEQNGGGNDRLCEVKLFVRYSEDDITYTDYFLYHPFANYFQYYQYKVEARAAFGEGFEPKLTALERLVRKARSADRQVSVKSILAAVPGAGYAIGDRHLITAGAHADEIAECVDSDTPTWHYTLLQTGMHIWDENTEQNTIYSNSKQQQPYCLQGFKPLGYDVSIACNGALTVIQSITTVVGDFDEDKDEFFIKVCIFTGAPPVVNDQVQVQWNDSIGGWTTIYDSGNGTLGINVYKTFLLHVTRCPVLATACIVQDDLTPAVAQRTVGLAANWMENGTGIRVRAMGDAGAKASAWFYVGKQF